jgi:hypothetical protein
VGMARDGRFVIVWESANQDGSNDAAAGRRYTAAGTAQGADFQVNTYTTNAQGEVAVAVARDGSFLVVWESENQEGTGGDAGIFAQRHNASGTRLGAEFRVNTYTTGDQGLHSAAFAPDKSFIVVSASLVQVPGGNGDTFARRFDSTGNPIGIEFLVNTYTSGYQIPLQQGPAVAIDAGGNFVVVWTSLTTPVSQDGSAAGVFGQRFASSGSRIGGEFQVNSYTTGGQYSATIAMATGTDRNGHFVVVWHSDGQDGSDYGIFGQRFDASANRLGAEFQINTYTTGEQYGPVVTSDAQGNFAVSWDTVSAGLSSQETMARRFSFNGTARSAEFRVNTYTSSGQGNASIASDLVGNFTVAWESYPQDGSSTGIYAQRFGGLFPRAIRVDTTGNKVWEPGETVDVRPTWRNDNGAAQTFTEALGGINGPAGALYTVIDGMGNYGTVPTATDGECTDCYQVSVDNPLVRPAQHWDASVLQSIFPDTQGQRKRTPLHIGNSFTDVSTTGTFYPFIETLLHHGITGGCGGTSYCPASSTTRAQIAVFALIAKEGVGYVPPACTTPAFTDVPPGSPFCPFIEELARRGVVGGCGGGAYCPGDSVTRAQMAVIVLLVSDPVFTPPACTAPVFADVPATNGFCPWIEELARRGIVAGCGGGNYCPGQAVTRAQIGVFVSATFGLTLYGT